MTEQPAPPKAHQAVSSQPHNGGLLFSFVDEEDICEICGNAMAEVGGLCIGCDHLQGDIQIDQKGDQNESRTRQSWS